MGSGKRIVIVGGVAGGASAAARARRLSEKAEIVLFERGKEISFANCGLPYHIGGDIKERKQLLVQTPESMRRRFRIEVRVRTEVVAIDRVRKEVRARNLDTGEEMREPYDVLILAPGAEPVRPPIPGIGSQRIFTLRHLTDMDAIEQRAEQVGSGRALILGGGYIGLEMAEALKKRGMKVTLVEIAEQVLPPADPEMVAPLHRELRDKGIDLRLRTAVRSFQEEGERTLAILEGGEVLFCDLVVVAAGVRPEVTLAREAGLALGRTGGILVDQHLRTSDPCILAVGDAIEVTDLVGGNPILIPLAGPANRQGRMAAENALGGNRIYQKTQGTAICKVFDLTFAMTGRSEKALRQDGLPYQKIYLHPPSHASYYPTAHPISLKLLFHPQNGKILGAQAVGREGVDKRIDVLAVALRAGLTVFDLEEMELCYAPPYGSAKDPVNYAGFVAANALRGLVALCQAEDLLQLGEDQGVLDVRTPAEVKAGGVPGAVNIPLDELRQRLPELSPSREWLVMCRSGLRSYIACRILSQHGFRCRNLTGGYLTYRDFLSVRQGREGE
jgi:NADPH-dependent 2,4-dienoyl-CoA reductase/sulfur reductase-like enzyme/rhodanese-related sulfurtransferase